MMIDSFLTELEESLIYTRGCVDSLDSRCIDLLNNSKSMESRLVLLEGVNTFFTDHITKRVLSVRNRIEDIINRGLLFIYKDSPIKITIEPVFKFNKTQFLIKISNDGVESDNLRSCFGGGVLAIVSFLFKCVINVLYKNEKFMVFDESLNFVSKHYQESLSLFIREFCEEMDVTIVLITHQPLVAESAHTVYEAYRSSDSTRFRMLESAPVPSFI